MADGFESVFVYRDTLFELVTYSGVRCDAKRVLFGEGAEGTVVVKQWDQHPELSEIRTAADEYVTKRVMDATHASGDVVCDVCKEKYYNHPPFRGAFFMEHPYLTRICRGQLVKL